MSYHRVFATGPVSGSGVLPLAAHDVHHLVDVRRVHPGESIVVVADDEALLVRITAVSPGLHGEVIERLPTPPTPRVMLAQGLAKGEKMDTIVRQTTEIGVSAIVPLLTERSVVRLDPGKTQTRLARWQRIAAEAAKQAQRHDVPTIHEPTCIESLAERMQAGVMLVCQEEDSSARGIAEAIASAGEVANEGVLVIVGPEGGLAPDELARLEAAGARRVTLGPTVLRTETAGVVAVALAMHALGGLGACHG